MLILIPIFSYLHFISAKFKKKIILPEEIAEYLNDAFLDWNADKWLFREKYSIHSKWIFSLTIKWIASIFVHSYIASKRICRLWKYDLYTCWISHKVFKLELMVFVTKNMKMHKNFQEQSHICRHFMTGTTAISLFIGSDIFCFLLIRASGVLYVQTTKELATIPSFLFNVSNSDVLP